MSRSAVPFAALSLACMLLGSLPAAGQADPFAGWDELLDDDYHFDSDERSLLGFSVRAPIDARAAIDAAERSLDAGDAEAAAAQLLDIVRTHGKHVIQVAEGADRWNSRWVGAGEWALYQLLTRISLSRREDILSQDERAELTLAGAWHDGKTLARLALEHEGLPTALPALADLARLQTEEGRFAAARATLERLQRLGGEQQAQRLASVLPAETRLVHEPFPLQDGLQLDSSWSAGAGLVEPSRTVLAQLTDGDRDWINPFVQNTANVFQAPLAPIVPVIADGVVYLSDTISIWAQDLLSGRRLWHHRGPLETVDSEYPNSESFHLGIYARYDRLKAINPHQLAQPLIAGERVIATVQIAEPWHELDEFDGYPINHPLPRRRLRALDRVTGELLWTQERPLLPDDAFVNRFDVDGPALVDGQAVFASGSVTEGSINAYLAAFDLLSGELLWRTPLCSGQQELTMFNRPFQEHVISPPTLHEGSLYVCTNLGVIGCVDAWSGRVRWLAAYESIERRSSLMVRPQNVRDVYWLNQPPIVIDETLVVAPLDGAKVQGLDRRTGRRLFDLGAQMSASRRPPLRHQVLDAGAGRFVVVNDEGVECYNASSGRLEWMSGSFGNFEELSGAAVVDGGRLLVPAESLLIALDLGTGKQVGIAALPDTGGGRRIQRVVPEGAALVMTDGDSVLAFVDHEALRSEALLSSGQDPRATLTLAELALAEGDLAGAASSFEQVLADRPGRALSHRARSGRLEAALQAAVSLDTTQAWSQVLEVAGSAGERFVHAERVLKALLRLDDERQLVEWLAVLVADGPQQLLNLDADGPLPAALQYTLRRLPFESPEQQLALLQQLLPSAEAVLWEGLPLADAVRRRIGDLLVRHGRALYAPYEARARELLAGGVALDEIEARFPNAALVAAQRVLLMEQLLAAGDQRRVFEEARDTSIPALVALRARAARAMGEFTYADALEGSRSVPRVEWPGLPRDAEGLLRVVLSADRSVELHHPTGRAAPESAGTALLSIRGSSALLLLDTRTGQVLWDDKPLPGGVRAESESLEFHRHGELLLVRGKASLQAMTLSDGALIWERTLAGKVDEMVPMAGLMVSLAKVGDRYRVEGHGMATGARAFRIDLPEVEDVSMVAAGEQLVCLTTGGYNSRGRGQDKRLLVLDLVRGAVASSTVMGDGFRIAASVSDPPVVLLSERVASDSRLVAFSPETAQPLWEHLIENANVTSRMLFPTASDRLLLRLPGASLGGAGGKADRDRLVPIDALTGPLDPAAELPLLSVVDPSRDHAPRVVLIDPAETTQLQVLDGRDPTQGYSLKLENPLPLSPTTLHHGRDGFVLVSSPYLSPLTTVLVVRGERGSGSYSLQLDDADQRGGYQVELVEGAVVLANGGVVRILRSSMP